MIEKYISKWQPTFVKQLGCRCIHNSEISVTKQQSQTKLLWHWKSASQQWIQPRNNVLKQATRNLVFKTMTTSANIYHGHQKIGQNSNSKETRNSTSKGWGSRSPWWLNVAPLKAVLSLQKYSRTRPQDDGKLSQQIDGGSAHKRWPTWPC